MVSRTYLVGLPVTVTVFDDGRVIYRVDTSETDSAIWEDDDCGYTEETIRGDVGRIQRDHARRIRASYPEWPKVDD